MAAEIKRAISTRQPWVELILRGEKKHEFRSRPTKIRGRVYLYAGLTPADPHAGEAITIMNTTHAPEAKLPTVLSISLP